MLRREMNTYALFKEADKTVFKNNYYPEQTFMENAEVNISEHSNL